MASWASIAAGNPTVDRYLDRLAAYLKANFTQPFFFTVHHEPENDVIERPGSGYTAADYAAMYRHVVLRLRGDGVTNLVTVMDYMAYAPWNTKPWFNAALPGRRRRRLDRLGHVRLQHARTPTGTATSPRC